MLVRYRPVRPMGPLRGVSASHVTPALGSEDLPQRQTVAPALPIAKIDGTQLGHQLSGVSGHQHAQLVQVSLAPSADRLRRSFKLLFPGGVKIRGGLSSAQQAVALLEGTLIPTP